VRERLLDGVRERRSELDEAVGALRGGKEEGGWGSSRPPAALIFGIAFEAQHAAVKRRLDA
jgi:hypothetical protein